VLLGFGCTLLSFDRASFSLVTSSALRSAAW
jgi:hypothetical protein